VLMMTWLMEHITAETELVIFFFPISPDHSLFQEVSHGDVSLRNCNSITRIIVIHTTALDISN